jgi:hypothetical protein
MQSPTRAGDHGSLAILRQPSPEHGEGLHNLALGTGKLMKLAYKQRCRVLDRNEQFLFGM